MLILSIETSTPQGGVAVGTLSPNGQLDVLFAKSWLRQRSHGELLTSSIEEALATSGFQLSQVDLVAVSHGPGSFTGIRVGLNAAKTLCYSLKKPAVSFSSLELLAAQAPSSKLDLLTIVNAHKNQCYAALFKATPKGGWKYSIKPRAVTVDALESLIKRKCLCVGDGYSVFAERLSPRLKARLSRENAFSDFPSAATLVRLAAMTYKKRKPVDWDSLKPLYIRGSEAEEKLMSGALKPLPEF